MYKHFLKRLIDVLLSLIAMPFLLFILIVVAPIIYFTDIGPIFYNAKRMGRNGKVFTMFKLRSMYMNSPDLKNKDGSTYNSENDPRVTPIGRILRKTSLDETMQFMNVLIGDMSIIGPRPTLASRKYDEFDDIRKKRLTVRPGITGYTQAYFRNSITQDEKFKYDCYYVDHLTFIMDAKSFFKTIYSVLARKNVFVLADMKMLGKADAEGEFIKK